MRKVPTIGVAVLLTAWAGVTAAQEVLPQHSGFGTGVGESSGVGSRSQIWDRQALLERLEQPETIMGRIFAIDLAQNRLMIETGGVSDLDVAEGRAGYGARTVMTLHLSDRSNIQEIKSLSVGDEVTVQAKEETTKAHPYGTGRKLVLDVSVLRPDEKTAGFGGLGQRPDPVTERAITTESFSYHGGILGEVMPGEVETGITSEVGVMTGSAPCWQCAPQPGWGYDEPVETDYGSFEDPRFSKQG